MTPPIDPSTGREELSEGYVRPVGYPLGLWCQKIEQELAEMKRELRELRNGMRH